MAQKPIKIKLRLSGGKNSVIPSGVIEDLLINIIDGKATFHFNNANTTLKFVNTTNKGKEYKAEYLERLQLGIIHYPNKNQNEIKEQLTTELKDQIKHTTEYN